MGPGGAVKNRRNEPAGTRSGLRRSEPHAPSAGLRSCPRFGRAANAEQLFSYAAAVSRLSPCGGSHPGNGVTSAVANRHPGSYELTPTSEPAHDAGRAMATDRASAVFDAPGNEWADKAEAAGE